MLESFNVQNCSKMNGFSSSVGVGGIFRNIHLNDSYSYNCWQGKGNENKENEQLFTDPELMKTIRR